MPRYKLRDANGATRVLTLDEQASYADLVASCGGAGYTLKAGRPPTTLTCATPATTPAADIVPSGSLITAEKPVVPKLNIPEAPPPPPEANAFEAPAPPALETPRDGYAPTAPRAPQAQWTCQTCTFINVEGCYESVGGTALCSVCGTPQIQVGEAPAPPSPSKGTAARRAVYADGNCLFVALAYLLRGERPDPTTAKAAAQKMRAVCASVVAADPVTYPDAALEKPRPEYGTWIQTEDVWGGALELSVLSKCGGDLVEGGASFDDVVLHCVDVRTGVAQRYGEGRGRVCFLLFDGVHYDPVVLAPSSDAPESPADITLVASDDMMALHAVEALAASERNARRFTDTSSFALQCLVCGAGLKGNADAEAHAAATGHQNFAQTGH